METKHEIIPLFSIPLFITSVPPELSKIKDFLEAQELKEPTGGNYQFGRRSKNSYILNESPLAEISEYILKEVENYALNYLGYNYKEYTFSQSWISHKYPGEEHIQHHHPNSLISGIFYYGQMDNNVPHVIFHKPPFNYSTHPRETLEANEHNYKNFSLLPLPGTLVLFPSELQHSVPKNETNIIRKSLAFNIVPKEGLGSEEALTELKFN